MRSHWTETKPTRGSFEHRKPALAQCTSIGLTVLQIGLERFLGRHGLWKQLGRLIGIMVPRTHGSRAAFVRLGVEYFHGRYRMDANLPSLTRMRSTISSRRMIRDRILLSPRLAIYVQRCSRFRGAGTSYFFGVGPPNERSALIVHSDLSRSSG